MTTYNVGPVLPHVQQAANVMGTRFGITTIGGYRSYEDGGYHPRGRALDFMCSPSQGDQLAPFAWANRAAFGVIEVIWRQRIITVSRAGEGWRAMEDRGSPTQNHMDHVHVSFAEGAGTGGDVPLTGSLLAAAAARGAGFSGEDLEIAVAVAGAESNWNPTAVNNANSDGSSDYGMWQINSIHASLLAAGDWKDPYYNAKMAKRIHDDAGGWTPWVTFNNGAHVQYLAEARNAVAGVGGGGGWGGGGTITGELVAAPAQTIDGSAAGLDVRFVPPQLTR